MQKRGKQVVQWFLDFDKTITSVDFCTQIPLHVKNIELQQVYKQQIAPWYALEYENVVKSSSSDLSALVHALNALELRGVAQMIKYKILQQFSDQELFALGQQWMLQDAARVQILKCIFETFHIQSWHCLSTNWSEQVIRGACSTFCDTSMMHLFCNNLQMQNEASTGIIISKCVTSWDKQQYMEQQLEKDAVSIYIGDSFVDWHCLCQATIGIVMQTSSNALFMQMTNCKPLSQYTANSDTKQLWYISNWKELEQIAHKI